MKLLGLTVFFHIIIPGLFLVFQGQVTQGFGCSTEWFGYSCQYKCQCVDNRLSRSDSYYYGCETDGQCRTGYMCERGWFGPACQYADLASSSSVRIGSATDSGKILTDGVDDTCKTLDSQTITLELSSNYPFTWMRIVVASQVKGLEVKFRKSINATPLNCAGRKDSKVDYKTLDIFCDLNQTISYVDISWENEDQILILCSVYISGGRNVALREETSQSTYTDHTGQNEAGFESSSVVDGNTTRHGNYSNSCAQTKLSNNPTWTVTFQQPKLVNTYVIYRPIVDENSEGLMGFLLESFTEDGNRVFSHHDGGELKTYYRIVDPFHSHSIQSVRISLLSTSAILTLCEVELFGDCPYGWYGLGCDQQCPPNCEGSCHLLSGNCRFQCMAGYKGNDCSHSCAFGRYGAGCSMSCSRHCATSRSCDPVTGTCQGGCQAGYKGNLCNEPCQKGENGPGCIFNCVRNCKGEGSCNGTIEECIQGCRHDGSMAPLCDDKCQKGWYGEACDQLCSQNCAGDGSCDPSDGTCEFGCKAGHGGKQCTSIKATDDNLGLKIGIGVSCGLVVLAVVLIIIAVVLFRRVQKFKSARNQNRVSYDNPDAHQQENHRYLGMFKDADGYIIPRTPSVTQENPATYAELPETNEQDNETTVSETNQYEYILGDTQTVQMCNNTDGINFPMTTDDDTEINFMHEGQMAVEEEGEDNNSYLELH